MFNSAFASFFDGGHLDVRETADPGHQQKYQKLFKQPEMFFRIGNEIHALKAELTFDSLNFK